jgi:hypothetical protein
MQVQEKAATAAPARSGSLVSRARARVAAVLVMAAFVLVDGAVMASATTGPDYNGQIAAAKDQGVKVLTDNVVLLLALPVLWVGYKVTRKIIGKIG